VTKEGDLFLFGKDSSHCDFTTGQVMELKGQPIIQVVLGKAHVVVLTRDGDVFTFGMNNKGQCGRDFPTSREGSAGGSGLPSLNPMPSVSNSGGGLDGLDDVNSDHDVDTEHENTLSEVICPAGKHKWKHDQCMVCAVCGECTGYGSNCVSSGRPDRNPGMLCGCGSGDSGCSECGCCHTCAGEDSDVAGAAAALASEKARLRDRLIRMEYLAAETKERYLGPGESEKFIRRRMQKMGNCRRSRRYTEKREGRRESELLKALESSMNKDRNFASAAAAAVSAASNLPAAAAAAAAAAASSSDLEKESGGKLASLPPARLTLPPGVKITQLSAGLHHTLLMSLDGDVYAFGSNTHGQLGLCDLIPRGCPSLIVLPSKAVAIAAGSYHSVVLTEEGQIFTFGSYQKGQLGREPPQQASEAAAASAEEIAARELWFALPGIIPNVGSNWGRSATWIGASSEQTFLKVDESLINAKSLMGSTIMANNHQILLLPTQHTADNKLSSNFKSLAISRQDGFCRSFSGPEQATFNGLTVNLDPMYNVLWSYNNETGTLNSYQPTLASQGQGLKETIVSPELALPMASEAVVSRNQAALNMLSCLDTLTHYPEVNLTTNEEETTKSLACKSFSKEDFTAVNRFDNHGGGWGYSGHSIEAIRFMVDTDILLGGFGLFGGRGEYVGKIKLFDIGTEGGDQEGDGELLSESDETAYECGARQKYPILFDEPVTIHAGRWYVAWARVSGPSSDCGSSGQAQVTTEDQIQFFFKSSKKSNNGTDVNAGQVPQLLYKMITSEGQASHRRYDPPEPICVLSHKFAKRVTPDCFQALLSLIQWSWNALKAGLCELMESDETTSQPIILDLQRLIYVCRACLRLTITYTEEVYPGRIVPNQTKPVTETQRLAECIYDVRTLLQQILTDGLSVLQSSKATSSYQHHKTGINMTKVVLNDAHRTFVACFHAFYPTGYLKWACLCNLLASMEDSPDYAHVASNSVVNYDRLLTAVLDALCNPMIKLRNTFPITYSPETETRCKNLSPTENLSITTSMIQAGDSSSQRFPILNELMNFRSHMDGIRFGSWTFREVLDRLLAIASIPVKQALKGDTTTIYSKELVEKSCQVVSSVISELANQTINCETDLHSLGGRILHMTPNRFTRTSNNRTWNTGNGSPDAICFSVDRSGIFIVGCCVYGGMGTYEYELELLDDQSFGGGSNNDKADHGSQQRWTSQEIAHGSYTSDDCVGDIAELKFDRAVPIKPNVKYALRLRNHGGRTSNGDGGISAVKGPDSTAFNFTSCSLSFNGTNPTRGQLPQILYFSSPQENDVQAATKSLAEMYARRTALSMTSAIVKAVTGLLIQARDCVEDEKGLDILNAAPIITKLMPHILASISSLAASDPPSAVQVLSFIQEVLPSVASLQNLYLLHQDNNSSDGCSGDNSEAAAVEVDLEAASQHSTWVESEHPYKPASVNSYRVAFPSTVRWMSVEFDPQCCTTQPEDVLQIYIRNPTSQKIVVNNSSNSNNSNNSNNNNNNVGGPSPTMPLVSHNDVVTMQKYTPVLKKFSGSLNWPRQNVILPGNEVLFSLETASDYVKDDKVSGRIIFFQSIFAHSAGTIRTLVMITNTIFQGIQGTNTFQQICVKYPDVKVIAQIFCDCFSYSLDFSHPNLVGNSLTRYSDIAINLSLTCLFTTSSILDQVFCGGFS
jgi:E3 ubiquitin-protein ligase MYCBP2